MDLKTLYKIISILNREYDRVPVCPDKKNIFRAFELCRYSRCKVVFISQDPYPQKGVATGILFGNSADTREDDWSPSLKIIKDAAVDLHKPHNLITFDPTLESWAEQGILMLNAALTVEMNRPGSHLMLWRPFISGMISRMSEINSGIIYVLFGSIAKTFKPYIKGNNEILEIEHPAYYARIGKDMPSDIFYEINALLKFMYNTTIEWYKEEKT